MPTEVIEPVLIDDNQEQANKTIQQAEDALGPINALLAKYKALNFERVISTFEDFHALIAHFDSFIQTERLKSVPQTVSGMKIDRVQFLKQFVVKPQGLDELEADVKAFPINSGYFTFYSFDATSKTFVINTEACDQYRENLKSYARGNQVKVLQAADKLMEAYNDLMSYGVHPHSIMEDFDITYRAFWSNGKAYPFWRLKDKGFCLRVPAEDPVAAE